MFTLCRRIEDEIGRHFVVGWGVVWLITIVAILALQMQFTLAGFSASTQQQLMLSISTIGLLLEVITLNLADYMDKANHQLLLYHYKSKCNMSQLVTASIVVHHVQRDSREVTASAHILDNIIKNMVSDTTSDPDLGKINESLSGEAITKAHRNAATDAIAAVETSDELKVRISEATDSLKVLAIRRSTNWKRPPDPASTSSRPLLCRMSRMPRTLKKPKRLLVKSHNTPT